MHQRILEKRLLKMIEEDLGFYDITTVFTPDRKTKAEIIARDSGIVSGIYELQILFNLFNIKSRTGFSGGDKIQANRVIFSLSGGSRDILTVERTALNILSKMSGISTLTGEFVSKLRGVNGVRGINPKTRIAATRKTTPLFGYFEKKAVKDGGGDTHRMGLGDAVLIKDNHLRLFGDDVAKAVKTAKKETSFSHRIEIEVSNTGDAVKAARAGADIIMLDNMTPAEINKTASKLEKAGLRGNVLLEVSGGVTLENISGYAKTGADVISVGALTHSAPALDFSLKIL